MPSTLPDMAPANGDPESGVMPVGQEWLDALDADVPEPEHLNGHGGGGGGKLRVDDRPEVKLGKDVHRVIHEVQAALGRDPLVYQRAYRLVTVVGAQHLRGVASGSPVIRELARDSLLPRLSRHVKLMRAGKPPKLAALMGDQAPPLEWEECVAPPLVTGPLIACADWPDVRRLVGVSETPVLRPDGTVHQEAGFDEQSGYLFAPSCAYPEVPEEPTRMQAAQALDDLLHVFVDFPHVSDAHKLVPIAALLTVLARPAIAGPVPAFLFDASTRGSGKTLQADVVALLATGRGAARATYPNDDEELAKVLASYALAGAQVVLLDNVTRSLGGGVLDAFLTARDEVQPRILGKNETPRIPWVTTLLVSGNNLALGEDTMRRVLIARLESPLESPEERESFAHDDLYGWVKDERPRLVSAAMTILRAYAAHGFPDVGLKRWGTFEAWGRIVAGALAFASGGDVMSARPRAEEGRSDDLTAHATILRELRRLAPDGITVKDVIRRLYPAPGPNDPPDGWDDMRDALEVWSPVRHGQAPDTRKLGERFRRAKGRIMGGLKLSQDERKLDGAYRWLVVPA